MGSLLQTEGLTKTYRRRRVVDGVSIRVEAGEIVGLLGPNGAGKTTSFRMVVGVVPPDRGTVTFDGHDVTRMPMYRRARRGLGYLSQEPSVFRRMSVLDNVLAVLEARRVPRRERIERAEGLLDELALGHLRDAFGATLSGGERRRLEIARALATQPKLLLLDEPFAGVDPITVEEIQKILRQLVERGIAILITDHAVEATLRIAGRAYILDHGTVIAEGSPQQVIANETVRSVYLGASFGEGVTGDEGEALGLD
ncbi:MAG: LPS export ABC transporter ATP-binding protein [Planctomycetota bacterium]|nr:LPS export ABC transporter ATP-binding protein [Planctomycetota bacterium]MDA0933926.1 LPS export ABC transporter ATP-binding protein [Planctomycetota bacterium]